MKLLKKAINIINKLEEGVGEVPPQVPSPGNISYYQSVDEETAGEWGPWHHHEDGSWTIDDSELHDYKKDPWGKPISVTTLWDEIKNSEGDVTSWKVVRNLPNGKSTMLIVRNNLYG